MKKHNKAAANTKRKSRIALLMGLMLLFCVLGVSCACAQTLTLPYAIKAIEEEAFMGDTALTEVIVPEGATSIGARAFAGCVNFERIAIPNSVSSIGEDAFDSCANLTIVCAHNTAAAKHALANNIRIEYTDSIDVPDGLEYTLYDTYAEITGYTSDATKLVIPDSIEGMPVTGIASKAFYENSKLTEIGLPQNLNSIGEYAFAYCSSLNAVHLPDSIKVLASDAFRGCERITEINYPKNWETVGNGNYTPFYQCSRLNKIEIPEGVTRIPDYAFIGCTQITEVSLPKSLEQIGMYAFQRTGIESIEVPEAVNTIQEMAFSYCGSLTHVVLPNKLTSIQHGAFLECDSLETVTIPDNVASLASGAFSYCDNLKKVNYPLNLESVSSYYSPFAWCEKLVEIVIPEGITTLLPEIFNNCDSLVEVTLPSTLTEITASCFENTSFSRIIINSPLKSIPYRAFCNCKNLVEVKLPETLTFIDSEAFANCKSLKSIDIPDSVTTIFARAFDQCLLLSEIGYPNNWAETDADVDSSHSPFTNCPMLTRIDISEGTAQIPSGAFEDCEQLLFVILPSTLKSIGSAAFRNTGIREITLPAGLSSIGSGAFSNSEIEKITIPESVTSIPTEAFDNCSKLAQVDLSQTMTEIGDCAFRNCVSLESIYLPDSITNPGSGTFMGCSSLSVANFPKSWDYMSGISYRWGSPFYGCSLLRKMAVPEGVSSIPCRAFSGAEIEMLYIPESVTSIGSWAFEGLPDNFTIYGESGSYAETYAEENNIPFSTDSFPGTGTDPEEKTVELSGKVALADGTPVEDVSVYVQDKNSGDWVGFDYTDKKGVWLCEVTSGGSYAVQYQHDVYAITPTSVDVMPQKNTVLDTAVASLAVGEGAIVPSFTMQLNGEAIPSGGVTVGDTITFSVTATSAEKVRLVVDGIAYNEYALTNGSAVIDRTFTKSGTRAVAFQAYDGSAWGEVCTAQTLMVNDSGKLADPVIHTVDTQYVGKSFTVTWDAVENADTYTVYLYRDELLWPSKSNTDRSTTNGTSMTIPGDLLYTDGEYLIEIIASGYGYSQSSSSITFTVEETAAGAEIISPDDGAVYNVGDTMHTRVALGSGTKGVRLLVTAPDRTPNLYAPENNVFYPKAEQVGTYVLTPYYSAEEGDFTQETADGAGKSVTVSVSVPEISSLREGTNKQYSIRYTGTVPAFTGSVSSDKYTVKVSVNGGAEKEITSEDGGFAHTADAITASGKVVYSFTPYYGSIAGKAKEFPVYAVEQADAQTVKYAAEPITLLDKPDGTMKDVIAFGTEVKILGSYENTHDYVSVNGKVGFIAAGSNLVEVVNPGEIEISVECLTDLPYTKLGENRQYKVTADGAKTVYAKVKKAGVNAETYEGEAGTAGFTVTIPAENTGGYIVTFYAVAIDGQEVHYPYGLPLLVVDASDSNTGKECWSNHSKMLEDEMTAYTRGAAEFDVTACTMHVTGTIGDDLVCVQRTMSDGSKRYAVVEESKLQYTKNVTEYRALCIVNPYELNTYKGDACEKTFDDMICVLDRIEGIQIIPVLGQSHEWIDIKLNLLKATADYNDVSYIYWTGHGEEWEGKSTQHWGILPKNEKGALSPYGYYELWEYFVWDLNEPEDSVWEGKTNVVLDSCFSGDFIATYEESYMKWPECFVPDTLAVLMATKKGEKGRYSPLRGSIFPMALLEYVSNSTDEDLTLKKIEENVVSRCKNSDGTRYEYFPSIWPENSDRIFFAEDPDAVK